MKDNFSSFCFKADIVKSLNNFDDSVIVQIQPVGRAFLMINPPPGPPSRLLGDAPLTLRTPLLPH